MRCLCLALALAAAVLLAGQAGFAQVQKCPGRPGSPGMPTEEWVAPGRGGTLEGEVASVAPDLQVISLRGPGGEPEALHVTSRTKVMFPDGNLASLSDIQPGQRVRASYRVNPAGQYEAEEVSIMEMGPAASPPLEQGRGAGPGGDWKDY